MSFEVGRLSAALTLDGVPEFHQGLDAAGRKLAETGQRGASFGRAGEAAVRAAAGATTTLTAAASAYLTILTKQGVAYNWMQQNSRAALKVLLGGAEQANAQMSKLDDFARNSPFSKSVFIQAQQQLIGFGMEAGKVVPTLDAIQQGVAAMGGSNEQITEVVGILAKVQSTGKFTAETLNELGYRGIDAATLMGDAMGKTAAQMREDISEGAIGGAEAIDVLVEAMTSRFGGAADGVKEQWSGAVDRIKAAQRDLGAHLAEPFVSAQGGGMAVTWGNQVADVLRAIEKQAVPVMGILTERSMPFFSTLTSGLDSAKMAVQRWDAASLEVSLDKLSNHAPGIAATAGAMLALGTQVGPLGQMLSTLGLSANPAVAALVGLAAASPEVRAALGELLVAGKPLLPVVAELATVLSGSLNSALPLVADGIELLTAVLRPVVSLVADIPAPVLLGAAAFLAMHSASKNLEQPLGSVLALLQQFGQRAQVQAALGQTSTGIGALSAASMTAQGAVKGLGGALKTAFLSNPIGIALTVVASAVGLWASANAAAQQKVEEHKNRVAELKGTLDEASGSLTTATRDMVAQSVAGDEMSDSLRRAGVSGDLYTQALVDGGGAAKLFERDLVSSAAAAIESKGKTDQLRETADLLGVSYETLIKRGLGYKESSREVYDALGAVGAKSAEAADSLTISEAVMNGALGTHAQVAESYRDMRAAIDEAQREQARIREATREAASAMSDAARSNERFNDALAVARDTTQDAETRVRALKQALDELKGGAISAEEAQKQLSETNLTLAEGFAQADENGKKLWQSSLDGAGAIDLTSRSGLGLADAMGQARDRMLEAARSASDQALAQGDVAGAVEAAQKAGEEYIDTLRATMQEAGLTQAQIDGLIGKYLDIPSVVATLLTDEGTISEVDQKLVALAMQIESTPDKSITITEPLSPAIVKRLEDLGYKVEHLPDGDIKVTATNLANVDRSIDAVASKSRTASIGVEIFYKPGQAPQLGPVQPFNGGIFGTGGQQFAAGGMASGMFNGVVGGIWKPGVDGRPHNFAEKHLGVPWETYISGHPSYRDRNIGLALETLQRLAFPVVPASALGGVRPFAAGGSVGRSATTTPVPAPVRSRYQMSRGASPLVGSVHLGTGVTKNDYAELMETLDRLRRKEG